MKRRSFLTAISGTMLARPVWGETAVSTSLNPSLQKGAGHGQPDILVIMTDQWNPRCFGYAGDDSAPTPNLDRLASEGLVFDNCYTPCPVCMPARCSLMSGLYPHNLGLFGNIGDYYLPPRVGRMFQDMQQAGYKTAQIGKLHWGGAGEARDRFGSMASYYEALGLDHCEDLPPPASTAGGSGPFQEYLRSIGKLDAVCRDSANRWELGVYYPLPSPLSPEEHNDTYIANAAIDYLKKQTHDAPYCLVVSFPGPHPPLDAPGRYASQVSPESIDLPPNVPHEMAYDDRTFDKTLLREARANYYGKLALIDDNIGRIFETVKSRGNWDDTLVIFAADHGEMMGAHGHFSKGRFYEESARIPLLMRWPGRIEAGKRTAALVQLFDVYPTMVEAGKGSLSKGHFARSLLPVALGAKDSVRDAVFSEISNNTFNYMVRMSHYVWWTHRGEEALYDLEADPYEMNNLIQSPDHQVVLDEMRRRHLDYFRTTQFDFAAEGVPKKVRMRELGGGKQDGLADRLYETLRKKHGLDQ